MNFKNLVFNFKINHLLKKKDELENLKNIENLSVEEVKQLNFEKRKNIVRYAYDNIPFYKEFYTKNEFNPDNLKTKEDWEKVPILTKTLLKENTESLVNPNIPKKYFRASTTGGSTGIPLKVYFDKRVPLEAFGWRTLNWWGIQPWENQAYVYRNVKKGLGHILNSLMWWPTRRTLLDCSSMNDQDMDVFIKNINNIKPKFIQGYVGGLYDLAKYINDNNINLYTPKAIWATAAPLSESTRMYMEKVFKAPVYDQYGCSEVFWLAVECTKKNGLHVLSDIRHIEFLSEEDTIVNNGEFGSVAITDLENKAFPIIRYKNGDNGSYLINQCHCGLPFPVIDKIKGRVTDNIKTPSGITVSGAYLTTIFDDYPNLVNGFQIIQNRDYSITINCVVLENESTKNKNFIKIKKELLNKTKNEIDIQFNFSKSLIQDRGKLKFVISEL